MSFSLIIFLAALWALSSEIIEDSLVDLVYGHMFGWRNLIYALIGASLILVTVFSVLVYYSSSFLVSNIELISKGAAILLGAIGVFWLGSSIINRVRASEADEVRKKRGGKITFFVALQLVSVEELEIFLILIPLILASHTLEATSAAAIGIVASVSLAASGARGSLVGEESPAFGVRHALIPPTGDYDRRISRSLLSFSSVRVSHSWGELGSRAVVFCGVERLSSGTHHTPVL